MGIGQVESQREGHHVLVGGKAEIDAECRYWEEGDIEEA